MSYKKYLVAVILNSIIAIAIVSCSKIDEFGDINQNPGATTTPNTAALLTNVLSALGNDTWDAAYTGSIGLTTVSGLYCQYFSETQYTEMSTYARPNMNWDNYYAGKLYDLQMIINYNSDVATASNLAAYGSNNNQVAVARILKAYIFNLLTDSYGDLPYFGALKADNGIVSFDEQQEIYKGFFKELTEAVNQMDNGNSPLGDILFNGDLSKWRKFANSIHALMALRLSKIDPQLGKDEFNAALATAGGVLEANEYVHLVYPGVNYYNPLYVYYVTALQSRLGVSKTMTDWLLNHNDSRINIYGTSTLGFPYGLTQDSALSFNNNNPNWARIIWGQSSSPSAPFPIMIAAEIYLARAEAAQLGWTSENVAIMYESGMRESWKYWGIYTDSAFTAYAANPDINLASGDALKKICVQEWIAHYPNGPRGWADWRRTGYPDLAPAIGSTSHEIPRRFPYGNNTYGTNSNNTNQAAARYTVNGQPDSQYGRVWWDGE